MIRPLLAACLLFTAAGAHAQTAREDFNSVTPKNFDSGGDVSRQFHLNAESYFTMATISRLSDVRELEDAQSRDVAAQTVSTSTGEMSFADYVESDDMLDGVIVLQGGKIIFEAYPNMAPHQRHYAWSVTKVVTSTALAVLVDRGLIDMQAPVETYVPALEGTAWAGISVQDIADMASGIDCRDGDGYWDEENCVYMMEEALGIVAPTGRDLRFMDVLTEMETRGEPGETIEYVSANTNVLGLVIEERAGLMLADAMRDFLWSGIGAEADGLISISDDGFAYASGGLYARLRDIARFGEIYTDPEMVQVLSREMVERVQAGGNAFSAEALERFAGQFGEDVPARSGWQWDLIWDDGAMYKGGYSGQGLYVDPARDLVIAWFGTGKDFAAKRNEMLPLSRQLARVLTSEAD